MKYFVVLAVFAFSVCAAKLFSDTEKKALTERYSSECAAEVNAPEDTLQTFKSVGFEPASDAAKCFANCLLEKFEFIFNGVINRYAMIGNVIKTYGVQMVPKLRLSCQSHQGKNNCESGYNFLKCMYENGADYF